MAAAPGAGRGVRRQRDRRPTTTCCAPPGPGKFDARITNASCSARSRRHLADALRHQGLADRHLHRLRVRRARRSSSASRRSAAASARRRWCVGTDASVNPESLIRFSLLSALSTRNDPPAGRGAPVQQGSRRLRDGRGRRRAGAGEPGACARARRHDARRGGRLRRDGRRVPSHALLARRQADHRLHAARAGRCRAGAGRHRLHQRARHRHAGERQDGVGRRVRGVRRARRRRCRSRPTSR